LAGELGVPALVIAGELFDEVDVLRLAGEMNSAGVSAVSLVERFGDRRARRNTLACLAEVVTHHLHQAK
jgi:hypothetical protein